MKQPMWTNSPENRRCFIGGSNARIIVGDDEAALAGLGREKRGEVDAVVVVAEGLPRPRFRR